MKVLAVGDIHTKLWVVKEVEKLLPQYDAVVFCGDYADDFGQPAVRSIETWRYLQFLQQQNPEKVKLVLGNHDYIYVNYTKSTQTGYDYITQTLIDSPEHKPTKEWLQSLPIILEVDGVTFSHAGISEAWNGEQTSTSLWRDDSPIWVRPGYGVRYKNIKQVVGHTPQETCNELEPGIWFIDTFSTYADGTPIGDATVLEIIDGKEFRKVKLNDDYRTNRKQSRISY